MKNIRTNLNTLDNGLILRVLRYWILSVHNWASSTIGKPIIFFFFHKEKEIKYSFSGKISFYASINVNSLKKYWFCLQLY